MKKKKNETKIKLACKKCGGEIIYVRYHKEGGNCVYENLNKSEKEHLHFTCKTCRYDWIGDCLDKIGGRK